MSQPSIKGGAKCLLAWIVLVGLTAQAQTNSPPDWLAWRQRRNESLAGSNGWTTLVGLHWLHEGRNFAGSDPTNDAVLPAGRAAARVGVFIREGRTVRFEASPRIAAMIDGKPAALVNLESDAKGSPTKLRIGDLSIIVIERGERIGLRVRDPLAPTRIHFQPTKYFPYDPSWQISGTFEPFLAAKKLQVADVTGGTQEMDSPGAIVFQREGVEYRLDAIDEGEATFFMIFRDATSGKTTYHSGRFLDVPKPASDGRVKIDFNDAYSPPCGFTPFATCPLPPRENWLTIPVEAGELAPPGH